MSDTTRETRVDRNTELRATRVRAKLTALLQEALLISGAEIDDVAVKLGVSTERAQEVISGETNFSINAFARYLAATDLTFDFNITNAVKRRTKRNRGSRQVKSVQGSFKDESIRGFTAHECTGFNRAGSHNAWLIFDGPSAFPDFIHVKRENAETVGVGNLPKYMSFGNHIEGTYEPDVGNFWVSQESKRDEAVVREEGHILALR